MEFIVEYFSAKEAMKLTIDGINKNKIMNAISSISRIIDTNARLGKDSITVSYNMDGLVKDCVIDFIKKYGYNVEYNEVNGNVTISW